MDNKYARLPVSALPGVLLLLSLCLFVSGCAIFGNASPAATPTPTASIVAAPPQLVVPSVSCDEAVQLILQKQVSIVRFWYWKGTDIFNGISIVQPDATPAPGVVPTGVIDDIDVYSGYHRDPTSQCQAQIRAAIKQVNATLPASQQVKVERRMTVS